MALYTESDDWQKFAREQMRNSAQNLQQKQAGLDAAKNQKTQTSLVSALSGLVNGIKERGSDILNTVKNIEKTKYGWLDEIIANNDLKNAQKDDSARRNEIAKKYGFNSYSEAINSDRAGDNFWNEIKASNEQTKSRLKKNTDAYRNSITDVTKVNTNEAKGQALNTIDSVLGLIPGVGGVVANVAGGGISGVGDEYKAAGREGRDVDWSNAGKNALVGMASGTAGSIGGSAVGKVAGKLGGSAVGKLVGSNVAKGTIGGASAGAVGGAVGTALNGGTLEDALLAAKEGAKAGAIGGGTMASVMGLGGTALDKIRNRGTVTPQTIEPADAQIVAKNKIQAPNQQLLEAEIVEPTKTPRGIAIQDLNAGVEEIPVKTVVETPSRGKYIDSVVDRAKANLPESKKTAAQILYDTTNGEYSNAAEMLAGKTMADGGLFGGYANEALADYFPKDLVTAIRNGAREIYGEQTPFDAYGLNSREGLPLLNRQEYYNDRTGKPGASITSEDIPAYMQDRMRNDAGKSRYSSEDNESIMRKVFGDNMDKEEMYDLYEQLAQTTIDPRIYSDDNLGAALAIDPELNRRATQILADQTRKNIAVQGGPATSDTIPVTDRTTRYTENTLPARQYQAVKAMPEAEIVANRPTTAQIAPEAEVSATATGWGDKNMTNASKKRNILQRAGETLQETGQATKDSQVYSKLKGNTAEEMARKNSVQRLRDLGFNSTDYDRAANLSEVVNKYYDDAVKATKTPIEAPQLRNIANEIADDLRISADNRADLIKNLNSMLDDAVARDGKMSEYTMDRYTPADLEKVAKKLGVMEQNLTTTNQGGSKKKIRNLRPEVEEYARALGEARNRLRNEIGEMADYDGKELAARMKDAGATQKQIDYVTKGGTLRSAKSATSLFEDARTMADQIKADAYKRGANATNSTNFVTQVANASGASNLVNMAARPVANVFGSIEKGVGKAISGIGNKLAGTAGENSGETAGKLANGAKNLAGKAASIANNATANLNNESLASLSLAGMNTLGNQAQQFANKQMGKAEAERSQNRLENAQAVANAQNEYDNALADYNAQEANYNAQMAQSQGSNGAANMLGRINRAMELAMQAGDITAYGQLADLYKQAYSIYEMQNPQTKNEGKALTSTQSKALAGLEQLETLKGMQSGVRTALADSPIGGLIDLTGGDEYSNQAKSLALTLGYLQSGANITPKEAEKIGKAYIPTAFDSEETRQGKLARAEQLLRDYLADTSALQA